MVEITVSMNGKLSQVLRGEFIIAAVGDDDSFSTAIVGRADAAEVIGAVCTLASRAAYELGRGDRKAGKEFLKAMEEGLKHTRKSPEMWHGLQEAEEIQEGAHD